MSPAPAQAGTRVVAVVNSRVLRSSAREALRRQVEAALRGAWGPVQWEVTVSPGDATLLVQRALEAGAELIISVGGDGTHNSVVNGFFDSAGKPVNHAAALAIFPCGTGNDLHRTLDIGPRPADGLATLLRGMRARIDVGRIEYTGHDRTPAARHFLNIVSFGISGLVDRIVGTTRLRRLGGTAAFYWATVRSFLAYRNRSVTLEIDDEKAESHMISAVAVANGCCFGGGMKIAPHAIMDDGLLDLVCLGDFHLPDFFTKGHRLYQGTHLELQKVWWRGVRTVTAKAAKPTLLDVDGDCPGMLPATISLMPRALEVYAGAHAAAGLHK